MTNGFNLSKLYKTITVGKKTYTFCQLSMLKELGLGDPEQLPFSIKVLLENAVRNYDNDQITLKDIKKILSWSGRIKNETEIAFKPGRVILQDFTGVPCVVDLAALRSGMRRLGGNIKKINPQVPCDLIIDHSVQVDAYGTPTAIQKNVKLEFKRNKERYQLLKWGQNAFKNLSVIPPATGIIHQINLEYLAKGILKKNINGTTFVYPDSLVGTDSHTTMINGLGIVGWGVGGIEAEAVMLGEPISMLLPEVIGFELKGELPEGSSATDMVLTVVQKLRKKGVVGKFVEFFGDALQHLSLPDRATISNMCPEYGATIGIFPIDEQTLNYYRLTGRSKNEIELLQRYMERQGMYAPTIKLKTAYADTLTLDLNTVVPSVAGPRRPQDRIVLTDMKNSFNSVLTAPKEQKGFGLPAHACDKTFEVNKEHLGHGAVVIASITSCTNTSNPGVLVAAGLLAKKAVEKGLKIPKYVKTSFIPGSQVVEEYLTASGLMTSLEKLRYHIVGYGCGPCIGNSGPLAKDIVEVIDKNDLVVSSVLSGNRNFEGRISPHTKTNYLASPALVIAFALAGTMRINFSEEPVGQDKKGRDVFLKDLWPTRDEINTITDKFVTQKAFRKRYKNIFEGNNFWQKINANSDALYAWNPKSTYIQEPPFFTDIQREPDPIKSVRDARVLVNVGDSITTDHISPAGAFKADSPAGQYLIKEGIQPQNFNSYGSRRGNDRVMTRGTFANIRLKNQIAPGTEGSWTNYFPDNKIMNIYDAALLYKKNNVPLIVLAGKEYGTGSSRDWAAKGTALLGVRVVIAQSYERIHRSNLAGMGILPLEFMSGESADTLKLSGEEIFNFETIDETLTPRQKLTVIVKDQQKKEKRFETIVRLDTPVEVDYFRHGGILQKVLRKLL
ncbi:MAG: aconitate hydratase AcnA [Candidatus Omnitrophica bacterium]|nr:aconitate hydratase AcnA [Candidatus Omnitrophota bacterium]